MSEKRYQDWDEFDWERELRKEDLRINAYIGELPGLIDLPDESDLVLKKLERRPELVPEMSMWREADWDYDEEEPEDYNFPEEWRDRPGAAIYFELGALAGDFSRITSTMPNASAAPDALEALCLYGRMMSWSLDIVELDVNELPGLKIALTKRLIAGANRLDQLLDKLRRLAPDDKYDFKTQRAKLRKVRENAFDIQGDIRDKR